jgi:hypothetical protein
MATRGRPARNRDASASDLPRLSKPAQRALADAGVASLADAAARTESQLLALHGFGPNGLEALRSALRARGLSFAK